jgi:hypothetical protein
MFVHHPTTQSDVSNCQMIVVTDAPMVVLEMISADQSPDRGIMESLNNIFDLLKKDDFQILPGVDSPKKNWKSTEETKRNENIERKIQTKKRQ